MTKVSSNPAVRVASDGRDVLLDVNVLLALAWPNHPFHRAAIRRLEKRGERWATCALTELGFIRLSSNPAAVQPAVSPGKAASLLAEMTRDSLHIYFAELAAPSLYPAEFSGILGHNQVTDCYLVGLARHHDAALLTFDAKLKHLDGVETMAGV